MKTLLLLRHGHAVRSDPDGDHARPLDERGRAQAAEVAVFLRRHGLEPEVALVSDAARTRETAALALAGSIATQPWTPDPALYGASPAEILAAIHARSGDAARVLVVGHNPGIGDCARGFAKDGDPAALREIAQRYPTGALAVIELPIDDWSGLGAGQGTLRHLLLPDA